MGKYVSVTCSPYDDAKDSLGNVVRLGDQVTYICRANLCRTGQMHCGTVVRITDKGLYVVPLQEFYDKAPWFYDSRSDFWKDSEGKIISYKLRRSSRWSGTRYVKDGGYALYKKKEDVQS